ncbi:hypothetical protein IAR50_002355 [Cryptococcus sp. DSM 104548]
MSQQQDETLTISSLEEFRTSLESLDSGFPTFRRTATNRTILHDAYLKYQTLMDAEEQISSLMVLTGMYGQQGQELQQEEDDVDSVFIVDTPEQEEENDLEHGDDGVAPPDGAVNNEGE